MIFHIPKSAKQAAVTTVVLLFTFAANAQRVIGDTRNEAIATQVTRVRAALDKLAPFQIAGCWMNPKATALIEFAPGKGKDLQVASSAMDVVVSTPLVQPGDVMVSIDGEPVKLGDAEARYFAVKLRQIPHSQLIRSGRTFVESYKTADDSLVSVANPVRVECQASDMWISDYNTENAATRSSLGLTISSTRLARLDDEQLLAFLAWNHAFMALRNETFADLWRFLASNEAHRGNYIYGSATHEKIDWVTLVILRSINANLNAYASMLAVVDAFDKAASFSLFSDKRFIGADYGQSPFGGVEKQARLAEWVHMLEQDALATSPASLKFSNPLLASPTWSKRTVPSTRYQTVGEALKPLLGVAQAKDVAEQYMANFDLTQAPGNTLRPGAVKSPAFQMLYVHHATNRLIWLARPGPAQGDGEVCTKSSDCSIIAVGPLVVGRPSLAWAEELKASTSALKLEKISTNR